MSVNVFVYASCAVEKLTYCSHTGILIYLNITPIDCFHKRQNTVKTSTFGAELIPARIAIEEVKALIIKLRWLGIPIDGTNYIFCDNESVVNSTSKAESTLSNKHQLISRRSIRDPISSGRLMGLKEPEETNLVEIFTKTFPTQRWENILNSIYSWYG